MDSTRSGASDELLLVMRQALSVIGDSDNARLDKVLVPRGEARISVSIACRGGSVHTLPTFGT